MLLLGGTPITINGALAYQGSAWSGADVTATFGALTLEGHGGVAVTGTSISSGDASGHWQISGGYLSPSATGEGAITGSYSLTLDNTQTVEITVAANRYDVRTDAELAAVIALGSGSRSGRTINLRPGTYAEIDIRSLTNTDYCTIQSDSKDCTYTWGWGGEETIVNRSGQARVLGIRADDTTVSHWRFKNLELYKPSLTTDSDGGSSYIVTIMDADNVEFTRCEVHCDQPATYTADNLHTKRSLTGIGFQSSGPGAENFSIVDCFFHDLYRSTNLRCRNNVTIARNVLRDMFLNPIEVIDPFQVGWGQTERTVSNLTIRDNVLVGHLSNADAATGGDSGYHQAGIAFQMERKEDFQILANIFLPVYWWSTLGGIDVDEVSSPAWAGSLNVEIKGNICIGQQTNNPNITRALGGCKMIGNTLFPKLFPSKAAFAPNTSTGPNLYWTGTESGGTNINAHNLFSGTTSGPAWGAGGVGFTSGDDTDNLGTGHGQQIVTDANGTITTWQSGASSLTVTAGSRDVRYSAIMDNGAAKNTAGDFCNVTDVETLRVRSDIATYLGAWVGALGSGYVTFQSGHMSDPKASTINTAMEPSGFDVTATFGALTLEQQGGVAVTGTSISSGDPSGHWRIDSGRIHPSAAGVGNLSGTYNLNLNNGETVAITIEANRRDVRTDAELAAAISAINGGTISLRSGDYSAIQLTGVSKTSETVIRSDPADRTVTTGWGETHTYTNRSGVARIVGNSRLISCTNLTFRNLEFHMTGASFYPRTWDDTEWVISYRGNTSVKLKRCCVHGDTPLSYNYDGGRGLPMGIGHASRHAYDGNDGIEIDDCLFYNLYVGIGPNVQDGPHSIQRNLVLDCYAMWFEFKIGSSLSPGDANGLSLRSNVMRGCWLSYIDTRQPGTSWPSEHPDGKDIHQASLATQGANGVIRDWDVAGNIFLPCYGILDGYGTYAGGLDFDGDGTVNNTNRNIRIRGNILVGRQETGDSRFQNAQGGCEFIYNTHIVTIHKNQNSGTTGSWAGPRINFTGTTTTTYGANTVYRNIICGQYDTQNPDPANFGQGGVGPGVDVNGEWYGIRTPPAAITAQENVFTGYGASYRSDVNGVITTYPGSTAAGAALGTSGSVRYPDMFNGNNANGDFAEITDIDGLYQTDAHVAAVGFKAGALHQTGSYVTFAPGHIHDPQDAILDETMEI